MIARLLATWFGCGYAPKAPGTAGSLAAIAIAWALHEYDGVPPLWFAVFALLLTGPAIWAADITSRTTGLKDPQIVVVDEVVGQWVTVAGAAYSRLNWMGWLAAFILFRAFDIWKPPPVRQLERLRGGVGIVMDDLMAGVYGAIVFAALVLFAAGWFNR